MSLAVIVTLTAAQRPSKWNVAVNSMFTLQYCTDRQEPLLRIQAYFHNGDTFIPLAIQDAAVPHHSSKNQRKVRRAGMRRFDFKPRTVAL